MTNEKLQLWLSKQGHTTLKSWDDPEFISLTISQINKDFSPYITEVITNLNSEKGNTKDMLILRIKEALQQLENENTTSIPQLMYVIDIPESLFSELLSYPETFYPRLAEVILIREAYKVWLRQNFS